MKKTSSWKARSLGLIALAGALAIPTPAVAGSDAGLLVCMVGVMSGQTAARDALAAARLSPVTLPAPRPGRMIAPDMILSSLPAATR